MAEAAPAYDYVVVGGGTAGCVPANRRSVDTVGAGGRCRSRRGGQDDWSRIRSADAHHATSIRRCHLGTNEDRCEAMASLPNSPSMLMPRRAAC